MLSELFTQKKVYYGFYVELKQDKRYQVAQEMYENIKNMRDYK